MPIACASHAASSRGRRIAEEPDAWRDDFQRDRDRIVHSTAFRRLVYKTQVFLNHEGDLFRTRLTHSLEVAQIARSVARRLGLNEDLVEAIALAHDLGHTPFGHAGQDALNECLLERQPGGGGFEHNLQSLRVVDHLEERYPDFDGLNLCFETREGILKHCSRRNALRLLAAEPGGVAQRFVDGTRPSLEAQLCNVADEIAYNTHDIDDGVRSGLLSLDTLRSLPLFLEIEDEVRARQAGLAPRRLLFAVLRVMLSRAVDDVVDETQRALAHAAPASAEQVRRLPTLVRFGPAMGREMGQLKSLLRKHLYQHEQVRDTTGRAKDVVRSLFAAYHDELPEALQPQLDEVSRSRRIADYIAGMTDRFALKEHERLTGINPFAPASLRQ